MPLFAFEEKFFRSRTLESQLGIFFIKKEENEKAIYFSLSVSRVGHFPKEKVRKKKIILSRGKERYIYIKELN